MPSRAVRRCLVRQCDGTSTSGFHEMALQLLRRYSDALHSCCNRWPVTKTANMTRRNRGRIEIGIGERKASAAHKFNGHWARDWGLTASAWPPLRAYLSLWQCEEYDTNHVPTQLPWHQCTGRWVSTGAEELLNPRDADDPCQSVLNLTFGACASQAASRRGDWDWCWLLSCCCMKMKEAIPRLWQRGRVVHGSKSSPYVSASDESRDIECGAKLHCCGHDGASRYSRHLWPLSSLVPQAASQPPPRQLAQPILVVVQSLLAASWRHGEYCHVGREPFSRQKCGITEPFDCDVYCRWQSSRDVDCIKWGWRGGLCTQRRVGHFFISSQAECPDLVFLDASAKE